jgi:hypothetical protein
MDIKISVIDAEQYDANFPPSGLLKFSKWLQSKIDAIPEEYREKAEIEIGSISGYEGSHYARISISYWRPETSAEIAERARKENARREDEEERARQMYEQLRQRFGS